MKMKKNYLIIVTAVLLMLFSGCTAPTVSPSDLSENDQVTEEKTEVFVVEKIGDVVYLNFDGGNTHPNPDFVRDSVIEFKSLTEMKYAIKNNRFTKRQADVMKASNSFKKDANGIKICDPDNLYQPVLPDNLECGVVWLGGENYSFMIKSNSSISGTFHCLTKDAYDEAFKRMYTDYFEYGSATIKSIEDEYYGSIPTKVYHYNTVSGELKQIRYSLNVNGKTVIVDESYCLRMDSNDIPTSATVPFDISVYFVEGDKYYSVYLSNLSSRPTVNWLSQIGIEEFKG